MLSPLLTTLALSATGVELVPFMDIDPTELEIISPPRDCLAHTAAVGAAMREYAGKKVGVTCPRRWELASSGWYWQYGPDEGAFRAGRRMSLANGRWRSPAETCEKDAATLTQFYVANKALTIGCRPITNRYLKLRFTGGGICEVKLLDAAGNTVTATTVTRACGASDPTKAMAMSAKIIDGDEGTCSARQPGWGCSAGGPNFVVLDMGDNFAQVASVEIAATSTTTRFWLFVSAASNPLGDPSKTWVDVGTAYSDSNNRKVLVQFPRALVLRSAEAGKSVREDLMCEMALCAAGQGQHRELVDPAADAPPCDDAAHACTIFDRDGTLPIPCRIYTSGHVTCAPANQDGECGIGLKLELSPMADLLADSISAASSRCPAGTCANTELEAVSPTVCAVAPVTEPALGFGLNFCDADCTASLRAVLVAAGVLLVPDKFSANRNVNGYGGFSFSHEKGDGTKSRVWLNEQCSELGYGSDLFKSTAWAGTAIIVQGDCFAAASCINEIVQRARTASQCTAAVAGKCPAGTTVSPAAGLPAAAPPDFCARGCMAGYGTGVCRHEHPPPSTEVSCHDREQGGLCIGDSTLCYEQFDTPSETYTTPVGHVRTTTTTTTGPDPVETLMAAVEAQQKQINQLQAQLDLLLNKPQPAPSAEQACPAGVNTTCTNIGTEGNAVAPGSQATVNVVLTALSGSVLLDTKDCAYADLCQMSRDLKGLMAKFADE